MFDRNEMISNVEAAGETKSGLSFNDAFSLPEGLNAALPVGHIPSKAELIDEWNKEAKQSRSSGNSDMHALQIETLSDSDLPLIGKIADKMQTQSNYYLSYDYLQNLLISEEYEPGKVPTKDELNKEVDEDWAEYTPVSRDAVHAYINGLSDEDLQLIGTLADRDQRHDQDVWLPLLKPVELEMNLRKRQVGQLDESTLLRFA